MNLKVIHHEKFQNPEGEKINRLVLDVNGHDVQVLQYDEKPSVLVAVDKTVRLIDIRKAGKFIARRTGEG